MPPLRECPKLDASVHNQTDCLRENHAIDRMAAFQIAGPGSGLAETHPLRKFGSEFSVQGEDPIRHHVRRKVRYGVMVNPASHTKFLTDPRVKGVRRSYDHVLMFAQTTSASVSSATSSLASSGNHRDTSWTSTFSRYNS